MLQPLMHTLALKRLVLASGSPRRKQILENVGLKFEVIPSTFEENLDKTAFSHPYEYVLQTAMGKTMEVAERLKNDKRPPDLVVGADTVVTMDDCIFEKPRDEQHALEMLTGLSGRSHTVYTGVVLVSRREDGKLDSRSFYEGTEVTLADVSQETLRAYVQTGEPMDKAGGYGIQVLGGTLVSSITGDYFNVMGFPLHRFSIEMCKLYQEK